MKLVTLFSGGLDSTTLVYYLRECGDDQILLSFDYGQRHVKELQCASNIASNLGLLHHIIDLTSLTSLLVGSALTDPTVDVPDGHYESESMKITIVPNRNAIMLSIAVAIAQDCNGAAFAAHSGDHTIYPDCRKDFVRAFEIMESLATGEQYHYIWTPFIDLHKHEIVQRGAALGVPFELTWSCYKGGAVHCGRCGTCIERREAFERACVPDPTEYEE